MRLMAEAQSGMGNPAEARTRIGAFALAADTMGEEDFLNSFGRSFAGLAADAWPERGFACTAVDAGDGAFQLWTKASGVGIARAVASSCSVPGVYPPVTLLGRRYIDGGMRSAANVDLAKGYDRVVVLAPIARGAGPMASVDSQVTGLVARVAVVTPDEAGRTAIGRNVLDPAARAPSARAGRAQAKAVAERVAEAWNA
jgi:NTE family protein